VLLVDDHPAVRHGIRRLLATRADLTAYSARRRRAEQLCVVVRRLFGGRQYLPEVPESIAAALRSRLPPRAQAIFSMLIHGDRRPLPGG
jgi:DNA-binding NarL/FixJ family response regulator